MKETPKVQQEIQAYPLTQEDQHLIDTFMDLEKKQLEFLDESGKSLIERTATFLAILFAITAFSEHFPPPYLQGNLALKIVTIVTLIPYLGALAMGSMAIHPRKYKLYIHNLSAMRTELDKMLAHKSYWITGGGYCFATGSICLAILIIAIILSI